MALTRVNLDPAAVRELYGEAQRRLRDNVRRLDCFPQPVLTIGPGYPGIWLEHNHDSLLCADYDMAAALASHEIFYHFQREDGLIPAMVRITDAAPGYFIGYGQLQTVYPLAASAYELAVRSGDEGFLRRSYEACARYDAWLCRYRDTRGTGLFELFCEYDSGHDNSPRVTDGGIPRRCPEGDARRCPESEVLPLIAPDLSACVYRGRVALGDMAAALGRDDEAGQWRERAEALRRRIIELCYDPVDEFFYDIDRHGRFRRYRAEQIFRMFMCGVPDKALFDRIYERHILNPAEFNAPYPFPSVALDDPSYKGERLSNNWGGMSQAHTALETLFWMRQYGRGADFEAFASIWLERYLTVGRGFPQELHPVTGAASDCAPWFTTSLLAYVKFAEAVGHCGEGEL